MEYGYLFAVMGTALIFFIYKTISLYRELIFTRRTVLGIALGELEVKVNHKTREISMNWKEER